MTSWIAAIGSFCFFCFSLAILLHSFREARDLSSLRDFGFLIAIFGIIIVCLGIAAWDALPVFLLFSDLFQGSQLAQDVIDARENARGAARAADALSYATAILSIVDVLLTPLLVVLVNMRHNLGPGWLLAFQRFLVLLSVPIAYMFWVGTLEQMIGITLPGAFVSEWIVGSPPAVVGLWTYIIWIETYWIISIYMSHAFAIPLGPIAIIFVPFPLLPCLIGYYEDYSVGTMILLYLVSIFLACAFYLIRCMEKRAEIQYRYGRAKQVKAETLNSPVINNVSKIALYLRPFCSTGTLGTQNNIQDLWHIDFETVLAMAVEPHMQLVALSISQEAEVVGAGRIWLPDTEWWASFQKLASSATIIFILPSHQLGTLEEVRWLVEQKYLSKCIFIMPETPPERGLYREFDHSRAWQMAKDEITKVVGIALPGYNTSGAMFTLRENGSINTMIPLDLSHTFRLVWKVRKAIQAVTLYYG